MRKTGHITKKDPIPTKDLVHMTVMARKLPQMAMKAKDGTRVKRMGRQLVPAQNNYVDHLANLKELYSVVGMSACDEYYNTIMKRMEAKQKVTNKKPGLWKRLLIWLKTFK